MGDESAVAESGSDRRSLATRTRRRRDGGESGRGLGSSTPGHLKQERRAWTREGDERFRHCAPRDAVRRPMGDVTHRLRTTTRTYSELVLLRESPVHGLTDCIVPFRIECMPHVVSEHNVTARIRTELPLESPADRNECVPSP